MHRLVYLSENSDSGVHRVKGTYANGLLVRGRELKLVEQGEQIALVMDVQPFVALDGAKRGPREPGEVSQSRRESLRRVITLDHRNVPKQGHRVVMPQPVVLRPYECRHSRGWHAILRRFSVNPSSLEVLEQPLIVPTLFFDMCFQVHSEPGCYRIVVRASARLFEGAFQQGHRRPDHHMHGCEVRRVHVADQGAGPQPLSVPPDLRIRVVELGTQPGASAVHDSRSRSPESGRS